MNTVRFNQADAPALFERVRMRPVRCVYSRSSWNGREHRPCGCLLTALVHDTCTSEQVNEFDRLVVNGLGNSVLEYAAASLNISQDAAAGIVEGWDAIGTTERFPLNSTEELRAHYRYAHAAARAVFKTEYEGVWS